MADVYRWHFADPKADTVLMLDGKKVIVPQGSPIHFSEYSSSRFGQSEYLVYSESQVSRGRLFRPACDVHP